MESFTPGTDYDATREAIRQHAQEAGATAYQTAAGGLVTGAELLAQRLARHVRHHRAELTLLPGGSLRVEYPEAGAIVWYAGDQHGDATPAGELYAKGARDASNRKGWTLSEYGVTAWTVANVPGTHSPKMTRAAYQQGVSAWWISYEGNA